MDEDASDQAGDIRQSGVPVTAPLSARGAGRAVGVSERTIRRAIARGDLWAARSAGGYQIDQNDLERYRSRIGSDRNHAGSDSRRVEIPYPSNPLIGRKDEGTAIRDLLLRQVVRLVTLTGPGGVGKTHLAVTIAQEIVDVFADGACFVDLSSLSDSHLVLSSVAQAIGLRHAGGIPIDRAIIDFLQPRELLLVLDNCEQVISAAVSIANLLTACPSLHILATSRIPLRVLGEHRFPVEPLPLPMSDQATEEVLTQSDAIRLFLERAGAIQPTVATSLADVRAIASICRRLDGLPLAIELAAARSVLFPPATLLANLDEHMRHSGVEPRDLPIRQRTIWETIAWSYDLLPPEAQALFRRFGVFIDGFDIDAASAIANQPGTMVLECLAVMVEHSLLRRIDRSGEGPRLAMLQTVREFASHLAAEQGELDIVRALHAEHFLILSEQIGTVLYGPHMRDHLNHLEVEHRNCLAALGYLIEIADVTRELRLAAIMSDYWLYRGQLSDGVTALHAAVQRDDNAESGPLARAMLELAALHLVGGSLQEAERLSMTSVALARNPGDDSLLRLALWVRGSVVGRHPGGETEALIILQECLALGREQAAEEASLQSASAAVGTLLIRLGERERGVAMIEHALSLLYASERHLEVGTTQLRLGRLDHYDGKGMEAATRYAAALRAYQASGIVAQTSFVLADLSRLAYTAGYPVSAARVTGMVEAITERSGARTDGHFGFVVDYGVSDPRTPWADRHPGSVISGRTLPFDEALKAAIAIADALAAGRPPPGDTRSITPRAPTPLSTREHHVLALLAQRYTAPEIAEQLFLSVRTVERHVSNVYNKLGVNSRRAAVAAATHHGLV